MNQNQSDSYLAFRIGKEIFAITVHKVLEVLELQKITEIPNTPDYLKGVINLRGDVIPVMDLRVKFNQDKIKDTSKTVIIILDLVIKDKNLVLGAIADSVKEVLEIIQEEIKPLPDIGGDFNGEVIKGMRKTGTDLYLILDIDKVFSISDYQIIKGTEDVIQETDNE